MNKYTAASGEIDGQYIKNKSNLGIIKTDAEGNYTIKNFGTGW